MSEYIISSESCSWKLYFLGWLDALEKLDVPVIELRHLQSTCIYQIRMPIMLDLLRTEEVLFSVSDDVSNCGSALDNKKKEEWEAFSKDIASIASDDPLPEIKRIVRRWVPLFPTSNPENKEKEPMDEGGRERYPEARVKRIVSEIQGVVSSCWHTGVWGESRKDLYNFLTAAQRIKRQILTDRLLLFIEGGRALGLFSGSSGRISNIDKKGPELWVLRMAVLSRAQTYLQRLEDLQQRLGQNLEVTPPEYPRPAVHRRREQGAYNQYLAHRVTHLRKDMDSLLQYLGCERIGQTSDSILTLHRWSHGFTSRQGVFVDEVSRGEEGDSPSSQRNMQDVEFVQTGYWMLDRQENQPIISHEVAHHAIRRYYENLQLQNLANAPPNDAFASLMRDLIFALKSFSIPYETNVWSAENVLVNPQEIACDLLAASTKANAYLFAFLHEVVGWGLEYTMVDQYGYQPHLSVNLDLRKFFAASRVKHLRDWYLRGRILVAWVQAVTPSNDVLDDWLLTGVSELLKQINEFLDLATLRDEDKAGFYWRQLADRMVTLVEESEAAALVKEWRQERRHDNHSLDEQKHQRHVLRIPAALRSVLVRVLVNEKRKNVYKNGRLDEIDDNEVLAELYHPNLRNLILYEKDLLNNKFLEDECHLFKHAYDVPWQCSLLRAKDFLDGYNYVGADSIPKIYQEVNGNTSLGRRIFFLAMEFHLHKMQPPAERLWVAKREVLTHFSDSELDRYEKLRGWLLDVDGYLEDERKLGFGTSKCQNRRDVQRRQGEELEKLVAMMRSDNELWENKLGNLRYGCFLDYLSIHSRGACDKEDETCRRNNVVRRDMGVGDLFLLEGDAIRFDMVSKLCAGGVLQSPTMASGWSYMDITKKERDQYNVTPTVGRYNMVSTLGRYDKMFFSCDVRPLAKCVFPVVNVVDGEPKTTVSFFQRRETWVSINLNRSRDSIAPKDCDLPSEPIAILYVQLNRRYFRIDFLNWLAGNGKKVLGLCDTDRVFLVDGWADVALVLGKSDSRVIKGKEESNPVASVFEIQSTLYQHFLTSRTELVMSDVSIDFACREPKRFHVEVGVRMREDSYGGSVNDDFRKNICRSLKRLGLEDDVEVSYRSGSMDFSIIFNEKARRGLTYGRVSEIFEDGGICQLIDKLETDIRYVYNGE